MSGNTRDGLVGLAKPIEAFVRDGNTSFLITMYSTTTMDKEVNCPSIPGAPRG